MQATVTDTTITTAPTITRAQIMIFRYRSGETLQEIGKSYGITRERVRQVIRNYCKVAGLEMPTRYAGPRMRRMEQLERII